MSVDPFRKLVKLAARAFYENATVDLNEAKAGAGDKERSRKAKAVAKTEMRGLVVVVLDALTRREWIKEDELAKKLHLNAKLVRSTINMLVREKLIMRDSKKEVVVEAKEGKGPAKTAQFSYCALDYPQAYDVVRFRLSRAKKMLKDKLESKKEVMGLFCSNTSCRAKYTTLEIDRLFDPVDPTVPKCEKCRADLVSEMEKEAQEALGAPAPGEGEDDARRKHKQQLKDLLEKMETQLAPLKLQLDYVKDLTPPYYGSLEQWELTATPQQRAAAEGTLIAGPRLTNARANANVSHDPAFEETKLVITQVSDASELEANKRKGGGAVQVVPAWCRTEGMTLTAQQRGEAGGDGAVGEAAAGDGKQEQSGVSPEESDYVKAYYAALAAQYEQQQQLSAAEGAAPQETGEVTALGLQEGGQGQEAMELEEANGLNRGEDVEWDDEGGEDGNTTQPGEEGGGDNGGDKGVEWDDEGEGTGDEPLGGSGGTELGGVTVEVSTMEQTGDVEWDD